jgi:hypothetical protein
MLSGAVVTDGSGAGILISCPLEFAERGHLVATGAGPGLLSQDDYVRIQTIICALAETGAGVGAVADVGEWESRGTLRTVSSCKGLSM